MEVAVIIAVLLGVFCVLWLAVEIVGWIFFPPKEEQQNTSVTEVDEGSIEDW